MSKTKVLYIVHGHPEIQIGGAEVYAYELFQGMRSHPDFEPIFLARTFSPGYGTHAGTPFRTFENRTDEMLWFTDRSAFDWFYKTQYDKSQYTVHFRHLLETYRPDIVHIQHLDGIGLNVIRQIKRALPLTPIVYTLHELQAICHAGGLMLRPINNELCDRASPARCHECFPTTAPSSFFMRQRLLEAQLQCVDQFLAPSRFLLERYVEWGIPRDRIRFEEYGRVRPQTSSDNGAKPPSPGWFGFFGQLAPHKGLLVVLEAAKLLRASGFEDFHIFINGANLEQQVEGFQDEFDRELKASSSHITFLGKYDNDNVAQRIRDLAWVLVPSTWWENSPLVIQEAFMHQRPVICSDIGGMAEKVTDGIDGLHFRVGDPASLAATLRRAASSDGLWKKLQGGIKPIYSLPETLEFHAELYRELIDRTGQDRQAS